jgi:hypothetical protein
VKQISIFIEQPARTNKKRECLALKADKGNAIVILKEDAYDDSMNQLQATTPDGTYTRIARSPLKKMVQRVEDTFSDIKTNILAAEPKLNRLSKTSTSRNTENAGRMAGEKVEEASRSTQNVYQEHDGI